ncbi:DoxX family protein [Aestuariivivens marinum]|uniref:DoxX family protein n=1 Tax=Aestuariivivens marinum TaxID=2913555 RepID=UPI001F5868F2|nr:DoxX family protein [Aestuariivivens marinum]
MKKHVSLFLRVFVAIVLIQTLRFKFTAHPDSVFIFKTLGLEPYGRIGIGILELIAGLLLLIPKTIWAGALLSIGVIIGAIISHLTVLCVIVNDDGGMLFYTALITFTVSCIILYIHRKAIPF